MVDVAVSSQAPMESGPADALDFSVLGRPLNTVPTAAYAHRYVKHVEQDRPKRPPAPLRRRLQLRVLLFADFGPMHFVRRAGFTISGWLLAGALCAFGKSGHSCAREIGKSATRSLDVSVLREEELHILLNCVTDLSD